MSNLVEVFSLQAGVLEMALRGTAIYWTILILLRLAGRREIGSLGTADLLVLVIIADAAGDALTGGSPSVIDGMVVVATIVAWSVVLDRLKYYVSFVNRMLEPERVCLIRDGVILPSELRSQHVSRGELMEQLRLKGIASVDEVRRAYLEANGQFSVIKTGQAIPKSTSTLAEP